MWFGCVLGLKSGDALVQLPHDFLAGYDLPGGKLRLALGKGLKPTGGGGGGRRVVVHRGRIGAWCAAFQPFVVGRP